MALENRNQKDTGRFRVHIACPVCNSRCLIRSSGGQSVLSRMSYVRCTNELCGWSGVAVTEILRTVSPPSGLYDGCKAPAMLDGVYKQAAEADKAAMEDGALF